MGIFDKSKKKKAQSAQYDEKALMEIVRIVSADDAKVMSSARKYIKSTIKKTQMAVKMLVDRLLSEETKISDLQWLGCINVLIDKHYVCECDWKEEKEDFVHAVSSLKGMSALNLEIDGEWFDEKQAIPQWCEILDEKWKSSGCVMAAFDIDSDSYVMFPCEKVEFEKLKGLAESFGHRIDQAKKM